jgi:copper homeostasis protein CutC
VAPGGIYDQALAELRSSLSSTDLHVSQHVEMLQAKLDIRRNEIETKFKRSWRVSRKAHVKHRGP